MNLRLLRAPEAMALFGIKSGSDLYARIKDGLWTSGVPIGQRSVGWPEHEVQALVAAKIAGWPDDKIRLLVKKLHADRAALAPEL